MINREHRTNALRAINILPSARNGFSSPCNFPCCNGTNTSAFTSIHLTIRLTSSTRHVDIPVITYGDTKAAYDSGDCGARVTL